jgi:CheY-like chemotaxis protein
VYGIIKNHNGFIDIHSEKGKGTELNIYLPASNKKIIFEPKQSSKLHKGEGTILLIDDEAMINQIGKELLEILGYQVLTADNGKEALKIYKKNMKIIKLVILDMIMPVMGGEEVFNRLKESNKDVNVLLSSGYSLNNQAEGILKKGCKGFLQKPFSILELSEKIRRILCPE